MKTFRRFISRQARRPSGWFGSRVMGRAFNRVNGPLEDFGLSLMSPAVTDRILEIGFGNGRLAALVGAQVTQGQLCGIDYSPAMVKAARKRTKQLIVDGRVELREASIALIPYPDQDFDKVWSANTVYFWPDPSANIGEVHRVTKPGGTFFCAFRTREQLEKHPVTQGGGFTLYGEQQISELLERGGFTQVEIQHRNETSLDSYVAVGHKPKA